MIVYYSILHDDEEEEERQGPPDISSCPFFCIETIWLYFFDDLNGMSKHFSVFEVHLSSKFFSAEEHRIPDAIVWPHVVIWHVTLIKPQWVHLTRPYRFAREVSCAKNMHLPRPGVVHKVESQNSDLLDSEGLASSSFFRKLPSTKSVDVPCYIDSLSRVSRLNLLRVLV